ncbi:MAG: succinylglutamate desuccinylase/aspartoacylase family protein [Planctomycetota bacterium]|nr:succinylglutamate desuccinylase/aspartoacylase family protein [Planctomycetota bacterium]
MMRTEALERVLGTVSTGERGGPLVLVTVGIHGNEPAGLHAMRRVLRDLGRHDVALRGRLAAFVGNRAGLARNVRYVDEDMNRLWTHGRIAEMRRADPVRDSVERGEQRELIDLLEAELGAADGGVTHLDLHSTSGDGPPFTIVSGPAASRVAAERFGVPTLLGLDPLIAGTLIEYVGSLGHPAVVLEGGQNEAPATIDHHESAVWVTLCGSGVVAENAVPGGLARHRDRLAAAAGGLPGTIEVSYVHRLAPGEDFAMLPGFRNFHAVARGDLLAHSDLGNPGGGRTREVRAPASGILLMPRYQGQGLDGFFLGRAAGPAPAASPSGIGPADATATTLG